MVAAETSSGGRDDGRYRNVVARVQFAKSPVQRGHLLAVQAFQQYVQIYYISTPTTAPPPFDHTYIE